MIDFYKILHGFQIPFLAASQVCPNSTDHLHLPHIKICGRCRKRCDGKPPFPIGSPRGNPFFFGVYCLLFLLYICTPFLAYRFANVHRNSFLSRYKGRSLILPRYAQSDYHLTPCIWPVTCSCRCTQTR